MSMHNTIQIKRVEAAAMPALMANEPAIQVHGGQTRFWVGTNGTVAGNRLIPVTGAMQSMLFHPGNIGIDASSKTQTIVVDQFGIPFQPNEFNIRQPIEVPSRVHIIQRETPLATSIANASNGWGDAWLTINGTRTITQWWGNLTNIQQVTSNGFTTYRLDAAAQMNFNANVTCHLCDGTGLIPCSFCNDGSCGFCTNGMISDGFCTNGILDVSIAAGCEFRIFIGALPNEDGTEFTPIRVHPLFKNFRSGVLMLNEFFSCNNWGTIPPKMEDFVATLSLSCFHDWDPDATNSYLVEPMVSLKLPNTYQYQDRDELNLRTRLVTTFPGTTGAPTIYDVNVTGLRRRQTKVQDIRVFGGTIWVPQLGKWVFFDNMPARVVIRWDGNDIFIDYGLLNDSGELAPLTDWLPVEVANLAQTTVQLFNFQRVLDIEIIRKHDNMFVF